jgi:uncharacterized protein (DUF924 family)
VPHEILGFWFTETAPEQWWTADPAFDARVRERFLPTLHRAMLGELYQWRSTPIGRLAEVVVLDQFSRNVFRGTPAAFAQDAAALVLAQEAVAAGALAHLQPVECTFLLLPYMHSESRLIHEQAEPLFRRWTPPVNHDFELRHKAIIDRFGRYPHRNEILGRVSSAEELQFLAQPGSRF